MNPLGPAREVVQGDDRPTRQRGRRSGDDRLHQRSGPPSLRRGVEINGGASAPAIGRRLGGPSIKIVAVVNDEDTVTALDVAEGQLNDSPLAVPVLAEAKAASGRIDELLGNKRFDSDEIRGACLKEYDALPVIPNWANRKEPSLWDDEMKELYKGRNRVERVFSKAKQFRRSATRYEKLRERFLGLEGLIFGFIHLKRPHYPSTRATQLCIISLIGRPSGIEAEARDRLPIKAKRPYP